MKKRLRVLRAERCRSPGYWHMDPNPSIREEISVENLLERGFRFKERGFYVVTLKRLTR
ncbi:MAG: hypothetical protein LAO21_19590 [Acidobacteriia bacterium]|nr:hypothetical protein [Terriglobia bacterium]